VHFSSSVHYETFSKVFGIRTWSDLQQLYGEEGKNKNEVRTLIAKASLINPNQCLWTSQTQKRSFFGSQTENEKFFRGAKVMLNSKEQILKTKLKRKP